MGFYDRFELLELVRDDGVKTFKAREVATGRAVEAHLFVNPYAPLSVALLARIDQLPAPQADQVVDRGRHEGTPYVVTEPLEGYPGFREWVGAKRNAARPQPGPEAAPPVPARAPHVPVMNQAGAWEIPPSGPPSALSAPPPESHAGVDDQFASLFHSAPRVGNQPAPPVQPDARPAAQHTVTMVIPTPTVSPLDTKPAPPQYTHTLELPSQAGQGVAGSTPGMQPPSAPENPPGEFTSLLTTQRPVGRPGAPAPPVSPSQPGEFTQLFSAQKPASQPAPQAATPQQPASAPQPGEFTQLFSAQKPASPPAPQAATPQQPASTPQPGEFTQLFSAQKPAAQRTPQAATPQQPASAPPPGEFTQLFSAQKPASPPTPQPAGPQQPASTPQPGEFTQLFSAQKPAAHPTPQPPAYQTAAPQAPAPVNQPGEFTQLFTTQRPAMRQPTPVPQAPQPAPAANPPGEFTQLLNAQSPPPAAPQPLAAQPPVSVNQPGEFTRMLQTHTPAAAQKATWRPNQLSSAGALSISQPASGIMPPSGVQQPAGPQQPAVWQQPAGAQQPANPQQPAGWQASASPQQPSGMQAPGGPQQPGEFTRFFQAPIGPMPQSPVLQQPLQPVTPSGTNRAGEFTQRFGQAEIPQPPPPTALAVPPAAGNATQGFSVPVAAYPGYPAAGQAPYGVPNYYDPYNPYGIKGPSDFTQKFAAPAQLTLGQEDPASALAPPAASRSSRLRTYAPFILGGVVLVLIVVILILVFSRHS